MVIRYSHVEAFVPLNLRLGSPDMVDGLKADMPIIEFWLYMTAYPEMCSCRHADEMGMTYCGKWEGFTNTEVYLARKAREARVTP